MSGVLEFLFFVEPLSRRHEIGLHNEPLLSIWSKSCYPVGQSDKPAKNVWKISHPERDSKLETTAPTFSGPKKKATDSLTISQQTRSGHIQEGYN